MDGKAVGDRTRLIAEGIRARAPWRSAASLIFKRAGVHVGHGFDDTIPPLLVKGGIDGSQRDALEAGLIEHLISGEKSLRLYQKDQDLADTLLRKGLSKRKGSHPLVASYPGVFSERDLGQFGEVGPQFCAYLERPEGYVLLFTGVRSYQERIELSASSLKGGEAEKHEFESLIGIVNQRRQVYDAIYIPHDHDFIVVAADYPRSATSDFAAPSHLALDRLMRRSGDPEPVNLWSAVDGLYDEPDGEVVELGFVTDDDSVKHLKARQGKKCLRKDLYHSAGSQVVGDNLRPFKLAVTWTRLDDGIKTRPEILLPGTAKLIYGMSPTLHDAVFRGGLNLRDLDLVLGKIAAQV